MKKLSIYFIMFYFLSSCAFHTGNVSTGADIDCPIIYTAYGNASATHVFGIGGLDKNALIMDAKRDLQSKFPYKKGIKLSNYSADFTNTFVLFVHVTKVTVSADVFDCNLDSNIATTQELQVLKSKPIVNAFKVGDSLFYSKSGVVKELIPAIVSSISTDGKVKIDYMYEGIKRIEKRIGTEDIYKTNKDIENMYVFGFDIGEIAKIKIYDFENKTTTLKNCTIIALNKSAAIVEYTAVDGKTKRILVDKVLIKK